VRSTGKKESFDINKNKRRNKKEKRKKKKKEGQPFFLEIKIEGCVDSKEVKLQAYTSIPCRTATRPASKPRR
jgi:ribosomal protein S27E